MSLADFLFFSLQHMLTELVACELQRCTTTAFTLFMRPLDRRASHYIIPLWLQLFDDFRLQVHRCPSFKET